MRTGPGRRSPRARDRQQAGYDTNLAAEYHVLSVLHRKGVEAYLTIGNKKTVDIVVRREDGSTLSLDVKGLAGKSNWPIDNLRPSAHHYLVFVSFLDAITNEHVVPEVYIVPSLDIVAKKLDYRNPKRSRRGVQIGSLRKTRADYQDNWRVFTG